MFIKEIKGLHLATPKSDVEILVMAEVYAKNNPSGMIPVDKTRCLISTKGLIHNGAYVKMIKVDNDIHGFIVGMIATSYHFSEKTIQQIYCFSDLTGMVAYNAIKIAHEGLIKYAENNKARYVLSESNPLMVDNNFNRILEINGWTTFGNMSLWRTSYHENPSESKRVRKKGK